MYEKLDSIVRTWYPPALGGSFSPENAFAYAIKDLNGDGVDELVIIDGEMFDAVAVMTEKDGKINESSARLVVSIAVRFDKELAQDLLDRIAKNLPSFVEESVIAEGEERETECKYLSVFGSVDTVDYKNPIIEAVKFGGIAAAAIFVVTCFVVIIVDILKSAGVAKVAAPAEQMAIEEPDETKTEETEEN